MVNVKQSSTTVLPEILLSIASFLNGERRDQREWAGTGAESDRALSCSIECARMVFEFEEKTGEGASVHQDGSGHMFLTWQKE